MRLSVSLCVYLCLASCVDAPITTAQVQANGQLVSNLQATNVQTNAVHSGRTQIAETPHIYGILSTSSQYRQQNPTWSELPPTNWSDLHPTRLPSSMDENDFSNSQAISTTIVFPERNRAENGVDVYLHLRSFGLKESRAVEFVWSHRDFQSRTHGLVVASANFRLASKQRIRQEQAGTWRVEVFAHRGDSSSLIFARNFAVTKHPN